MPRSKTPIVLLLAIATLCLALPASAKEKFHTCAYADPYTQAQVQFLASHYQILAMGERTVPPSALKAVNPAVKVLIYKALISEFPYYQDAQGKPEWDVVNPNESWFIHDTATGIRLQSTDGYPWYLMDPASDWQDYLGQVLAGWKAAGYDGFFGDNGLWQLFNMWFYTISAEPAVTIGNGRTVCAALGNGLYGVQGVYANSAGTGTNYYSGGSYREDTITLGASPGPAGTRVYLTYYANAYRYREPATVDATGTRVTVRYQANWVYGVYDNSSLTGTNYYAGAGYDQYATSGERTTITLGRSPGAGRQVYVKYRADLAPAAKIASWHQDMVGLFDAIQAATGPDFLSIYNGVVRRASDDPYLEHTDGGMMEQFITVNGDSPLFYDGYTRWLEEVERIEQVAAEHPSKLCLVQSGVSKEPGYDEALKNRWAMFCFASYLLCRGSNTSFNFTKTGYNGLDWYPYWALEYGEPIGPRRLATVAADLKGQGIFQRDFTKCKVVVNPTGSQGSIPTANDVSVIVPLDGAYRVLNLDGTIAATAVTSINLSPRTGVILFRSGDVPGGQAPAPPAIVSPANGAAVRSRAVTVSGTESDPAAQVTVTVGALSYGPSAVSNGSWSVAVNLLEGSNKLVATATNPYGSASSSPSYVTVDSQPPTVSLTAPAAGASVSGTVAVTASAADPAPSSGLSVQFHLDGQLKYTDTAAPFAWSWDTAGLAGSHTLSARAVDKAGNAAASGAVTVTLSSTAPPAVPAITSPAAGSLVAKPTCQVSGTEASPGATVTVVLNGTAQAPVATNSTTWTTTVTLREGANTIAAYASSASGRSATSAARTVTLDSKAPAVSFVQPANGAKVSGIVPIEVTATDSSPSSGLGTVRLYMNDKLVSTLTGTPPYRWNWSVKSAIAYLLKATVTDTAGNQGAAAITVTGTTGTAPPAVPAITSPASGALTRSAACLVSGTEATAGAAVTVVVNGVAGAAVSVSGGAWSTTITLREGANSIAAYAKSAGGTSATSAARTITLDSKAPSVTIYSPANGATISGSTIIEVRASDAAPSAGLGAVQLYIDGYLAAAHTGAPPYRWSWNAGTGPASRTIRATVTDSTGNVGAATSTFRVGY